ncbi:MAG TPA: VWA domain-containing protein [Terriglobales bacterium]|nr:VWA domain-containing protein [Terriglobales bacterium]
MNKLFLLVLASGIAVVPVLQAQTSAEKDLPSAPSATLQQQMQRQQPPPPPPSQPKPQPTTEQSTAPNLPPAQSQQASQPSAPATTALTAPAGSGSANTPDVSVPATTANGNAPTNDDPTVYRYVKNVDEINVIFTVTDKRGRFVKNLKKEDFTVLDDNKPPVSIMNFRTETDLPLRVGLLVDASNSVRDRFTFEQEAAIEFLNQIIRPKSDKAFVIGFDTTAEVTQDFTDSTEQLSRGVRLLRAGGGTAMYDAIYYACRDKLMKGQERTPVRRAIILLSDGEDNQSRVTREEAIEMAQRAEVIIYGISTNVSGVKLRGDKILERMAEATGGRAFFPFKVQDVANAFSEIQDELRSQYALAYKPADFQTDGRYHSIQIEARNHKNLRVRARKGYFAPKE